MRQSFYAKEEVLEVQMYLKPCAPRSEPDLGVHPSGSPERRRLARQKAVEVHPDTNAFTGVPNESVAARLFQLAFPVHTLLLALCLASTICWLALGPQTYVQALVAITLCFAVGLVGRVLIHRCHDTVRAQKIGSWTWTVLLVTIVAVRLQLQLHEYWTNLAACPDIFLEIKQNNMIILTTCSLTTCLATALINGLHGMSFVHKCALLALTMFVDCLDMVFCGEAVRTMVFCDAGAFVVGTVISSWAELCLRRSFQEKAKLLHEKMEQQVKTQQLGVRNEQLRAEKERLLYDNVLQHRGCPIDDDNRSAICRGLQAESHQPCLHAGDTHRSEAGAPETSHSPPPSLPPGPPSSSGAGSSAAATHHPTAAPASPGMSEVSELSDLELDMNEMLDIQDSLAQEVPHGFVSAQPMASERTVGQQSVTSASRLKEALANSSAQEPARHEETMKPFAWHPLRCHPTPEASPQMASERTMGQPSVTSASLKEAFDTHVMCDFTPRSPCELPMMKWVSCQRLIRHILPHLVPAEVKQLTPDRLKYLITGWFQDHPAYADLSFNQWCKQLKDRSDPLAGPRSRSVHFPFEHTPRGITLGAGSGV